MADRVSYFSFDINCHRDGRIPRWTVDVWLVLLDSEPIRGSISIVSRPVVGYACNPFCVLYDLLCLAHAATFISAIKMVTIHIFSVADQLSFGLQTPMRRNDFALKAKSPLRQLLHEGWAWHGMKWHKYLHGRGGAGEPRSGIR